LADRTRVIFRSEPLGFPPIAIQEMSKGLQEEQALEAALLGMDSQPLGREILSRLGLDGFTPPMPGLYENIADKWRVLGGER
jgi:phosphonate transport system substrate-binding protein